MSNSLLFISFFIDNHQLIGTKVTKRAVENDLPEGSFGYSEYSQVFESETASSVPKVKNSFSIFSIIYKEILISNSQIHTAFILIILSFILLLQCLFIP